MEGWYGILAQKSAGGISTEAKIQTKEKSCQNI